MTASAPGPDSGLAVHVGPAADPEVAAAVRRGGGRVVAAAAAEMLVWVDLDPVALARALHPGIRWVQLPSAGTERWIEAGLVDAERVWMSAAGAYAASVAEQALALVLAGRRRIGEAARAASWDAGLEGRTLRGARVAIVGAGGIGRELIRLLAPHEVEVVAVTRRGRPVPGAARTLAADRVDEVWPWADVVVLAAPATPGTHHLVDAAALAAMRGDALLVNVARGSLVDHRALVEALAAGAIGGAALDVTDPEPLPDGHPLWASPGALITPHVATPSARWMPELAARVEDNVARIGSGRPPLAVVELGRGY